MPTLLSLLLTALPAPTPPQDDAERAQDLLDKANFALEKERYEDAVKQFSMIARRYPETEAGKIAEVRSRPTTFLHYTPIVSNGPSSNRLDLAVMGDGYTLEHQKAFNELADDVPPLFFDKQRTFKEYASYFNFWRLNLVSKDDNVDGFGREEDTALGAFVQGTIQGHVGLDPVLVRNYLDELPEHDGLAIAFVRVGVLGAGYPGIATVGGRNERLTVHEFGHAFADLGDEYSEKTHDRGAVRTRPNVSTTDDEKEVPWAHWIEAKAKGVGTYEGAAGQVREAWRPTASDCVMMEGEFFCQPCREQLVLRIYSLVDPIDWVGYPPHPFTHPASLTIDDKYTFEARVMTPATHNIEVRWWVLPEADAPPDPRGIEERYEEATSFVDRRSRGALWPIAADPDKYAHVIKDGEHEFTVKRTDLDPGRYRVVMRARDTTEIRGDKLPWVLKDPDGLLESERAWWIVIPERE